MAPARCAGGASNRARQVCRARFNLHNRNRPVAAFDQVATGRRASSLRGAYDDNW